MRSVEVTGAQSVYEVREISAQTSKHRRCIDNSMTLRAGEIHSTSYWISLAVIGSPQQAQSAPSPFPP
jgi:hypothetical protein